MARLAGRVAVVTGGGSGIGRATARHLAGAGARVVVADVDAARCAAVEAELRAAGADALGVRTDVRSLDDVSELHDRTRSRFGAVDVVMSNAGVLAVGRPEDVPVEAWARVLDVNVLGTARVLQVFLPDLLARGEGHVVVTASTAGLYPYAWDRLPYTASKAALVATAEALALYLGPRGIGVTCLCPGPVATGIAEQVEAHGPPRPPRGPGLAVRTADEVAAVVVEAVRTGRFLAVTDDAVAALVRERGADPDGFVARQAARVGDGPP